MTAFDDLRTADDPGIGVPPRRSAQARDDIPGLTGLRGIAALAVVFYHFKIPGFEHGWLAVDIFFALSGYVLAHVYRAGLDRGEFVRARVARLAPVHLVATGLFCILAVNIGVATPWQAAGNMALVQVVNPPTWSLTVEVIDYALFAVLLWPRRGAAWTLLICGAVLGSFSVAATLASGWLQGPGIIPGLDINMVARGVGWFTFGVGLYGTGWRPRRTWALDNRAAVWLGDISYPLYLVHFLALLLTHGSWWGIPLAITMAVLLHHIVEVPGRRWLRGSRHPQGREYRYAYDPRA